MRLVVVSVEEYLCVSAVYVRPVLSLASFHIVSTISLGSLASIKADFWFLQFLAYPLSCYLVIFIIKFHTDEMSVFLNGGNSGTSTTNAIIKNYPPISVYVRIRNLSSSTGF